MSNLHFETDKSTTLLFSGKPVTDAADGLDEVGGVSEFFAEGADVDVDGAFKGIGVFPA